VPRSGKPAHVYRNLWCEKLLHFGRSWIIVHLLARPLCWLNYHYASRVIHTCVSHGTLLLLAVTNAVVIRVIFQLASYYLFS
jgi:hypothetical protein